MLILTVRTDKLESEIGLFDDERQLAYETWSAHRALAETIHQKIDELLKSQGKKAAEIGGIAAFAGPGSFTGLRIGLSVANALAYSLDIPIVGIEGEANWLQKGIAGLKSGQNDTSVMPKYGADVHITLPKH